MIKNQNSLIKPFIRELLEDVHDLFPENDFSYETDTLNDTLFFYEDQVIVLEFSKIGKALEHSLISGKPLDFGLLPLLPFADGCNYPRFLQVLWEILFFRSGHPYHIEDLSSLGTSKVNSVVKQTRSVACLCLRQFFLAFSKISTLDCIADSVDEIDSFTSRIECQPDISLESSVLGAARALLSSLLLDDGRLAAPLTQFLEDSFGCHGPGAVSDGSKGRYKWSFDNMPGLPDILYRGQHVFLTQSGFDGKPSSKLAIVPKDFRGHRLICVEPKEFMFYQQGLLRVLSELVETHLPTKVCIDFKDQVKSQRLSRFSGSATIDLKDASDLVSLRLAKLLFPKEFLRLATVARAQSINIPDDELSVIQTLFTMGNALCFPFETLIFWSLSLATMLFEEHQEHLASKPLAVIDFLHKNRLQVFGDDIIVPRRYYESVCSTLVRSGLRVNYNKSCCNTPVREACGSWYYYGIDCRIVRLKSHRTGQESDWISLLESARLLYEVGMIKAANSILSYLNAFLPVPYGFGWIPGKSTGSNVRYNSQLQRMEVRVPQLKGAVADSLTGEVGLYSYFTGKGNHMASHHNVTHVEWDWVDRI